MFSRSTIRSKINRMERVRKFKLNIANWSSSLIETELEWFYAPTRQYLAGHLTTIENDLCEYGLKTTFKICLNTTCILYQYSITKNKHHFV